MPFGSAVHLPGAAALAAAGFPDPNPRADSSSARFPDGGAWRVEIPSVEGLRALEALVEEADDLDVPVHRVSQGSGVTMLTDREIRSMVELAESRQIELCLFARPGANWDVGGASTSTAGSGGARARGLTQLGAVVAEVERGVDLGVRSFLVADEGALLVLNRMRQSGALPRDVQLKTSIMAAPCNPASYWVNELLGADTINVPSDLTLAQLAEIRAACVGTMDFYVEAPDNVGAFVRHWEIAEIIRIASPVYLKFGLRLAPDVYPSGRHLESVVVGATRERVRRARIGLDQLERSGLNLPMSALGSRDQPQPPHRVTGAGGMPIEGRAS
ncbi:hypothetical protein [Jiangella asiatica]|nr:hypothetical protein [Jiangella asiatica]